MKKKNLISLLLVGAMVGTLLVGCGEKTEVETPVVEDAQCGVEEVIEATEEVEATEVIEATEEVEIIEEEVDATETVVDMTEVTAFYGLEIVPSGETVTRAWHRETLDTDSWWGGTSELPITATVDVTTREDGKLEKTVTYAMEGGINMAGDWTVNIFDLTTGSDLEAAGFEAHASEATRSEDGEIAYWSATIVYDETVEPVFVWTQMTTEYNVCARQTDTAIVNYVADMNKDLANYTDLFAYEGGWWFLVTK